MPRRMGLGSAVRITAAAVATAIAFGAASGMTFAVFTGAASSAGPTITTKRVFPAVRGGPAWVVQDSSGGGAGVVADAPLAINNDNRYPTSAGTWPVAFAANEYIDFDMNAPLPGGMPIVGATFNYSWRTAGGAAGNTCVQYETRNRTTGTIISTHAFNPADCTSAGITRAIALPELTSSDLANGVRVRVYHRHPSNRGSDTDIATITGTGYSAFTLYPVQHIDASVAVPVTTVWPFSASDGVAYTSNSTWTAAQNAGRYLRLTYPGYVPAGAVVTGATFTHRFRGLAGGSPCFSLDVYSGATFLANHVGPCPPVGAGYQTTTIPLPEINTVAEANSVVIRLYQWTPGGARRTETDEASVGVNWSLT